MDHIPFNKPCMTGRELWYSAQAHTKGHLSGHGSFPKKCHAWLKAHSGAQSPVLTHAGTAALLADIQPGDEVNMLSYPFVSKANAFVVRGGEPVCVDIRPETLNIDETLIAAAITIFAFALLLFLAQKYGVFRTQDISIHHVQFL